MQTEKPRTVTRPEDLRGYDLSPVKDPSVIVTPPRLYARTAAPIAPAAPAPRSIVPASFIIFALGAMLFGLSYQRSLFIGEIAAIAMVPLSIYGLARGAIRKSIVIAALLGAAYVGPSLPSLLQPLVASFAGASAGLVSVVASGLLLMFCVFAAGLFAKCARRRIEPIALLAKADRCGGALIGAAEGAFVVLTLCWVCAMVRPHALRLRDESGAPLDSFQHQFAGNVIRVADEGSAGQFGEFLKSTNPFEKVPALRDAMDKLNATGQLSFPGLDPQLMEQVQRILNTGSGDERPDVDALLDYVKKSAQPGGEADPPTPQPTN